MPIDVASSLSDQDEMVCRLGLLVYSGNEGVLATIHRTHVPDDGGGLVMLPGECLEHEQLVHLNDRLAQRTETGARRILPPEILVADADLMAWHRPAQRRVVFFETRSLEFNEEVDGRMALHPPLLFLARRNELSVFALGSNERPTAETPLFRAPYLNIHGGGTMCAGSAPIPQSPTPSPECIAEYEAAFFASSFAHTALGERELSRFPGGHNELWKMLVASDHNFFPFWALVRSDYVGQPMTLALALKNRQ